MRNSTPIHPYSVSLFQTPMLSPDEKTVITSPYQIPKMRKLSNLMNSQAMHETENYNYHDSNKLVFRRKSPNKYKNDPAYNMTNKILNQCSKFSSEIVQMNADYSMMSENEEFCMESKTLYHRDSDENSNLQEYSIVSLPAKFENLDFEGIRQKKSFPFEKNEYLCSLKEEEPLSKTSLKNDLLEKETLKTDKLVYENGNINKKNLSQQENNEEKILKMASEIEELKKKNEAYKSKNEELLKENENVFVLLRKTKFF